MSQVNVEDKVVFITGANRGIGAALVREAVQRGAKKVYAAARDLSKLEGLQSELGEKVVPIQLDVTKAEHAEAAAAKANDVDVLINNAGVFAGGEGVRGGIDDNFSVNVYGVANVIDAFLPQLISKPNTALGTVSSMLGLASTPMGISYSASKAAAHSIVQGVRAATASSDLLVTGIYPGPIDTDMLDGMEIDKDSPENVATAVFDGLAEGKTYIFPDALSKQVGEAYLSSPLATEEMFAQFSVE